MTRPLPPEDQARFNALVRKGREAEKSGDVGLAERWYLEAWSSLPEPKLGWAEGQIMTGSLVDFFRDAKQFAKAREWSRTMAISYGDPMNPYVRLLLGTVAFEEGSLDEAFEIFDGLHREDGTRPFAAVDPRYLEFVRSRRGGTARRGTGTDRPAVSWAKEAAQPPPENSELPPKVHREVERLGKKGDALARKRQYAKAIEVYRDGVDLLPRPKAHWEAATWLLAAIADAQFLAGEFAAAVDTLEDAKFCPGAIGNPFVHLRLGQCLLETGQRDRALDELARAYMGAGREIFRDEDPKYLADLAKVMKPPPGRDSL